MTAEHHEEHPHEVIMTPDYFNFAFAMEDVYITINFYDNHLDIPLRHTKIIHYLL